MEEQQLRVTAAPSASAEVRALIDGAYASPEVGVALYDDIVVAPVVASEADPDIAPALNAIGYTTWWAAAVHGATVDRAVGALMVLLPEDRRPDLVERQLLASAGSLAAIAVERDRVQTRLAHDATHDALTGLPNRDHIVERICAVTDAAVGGPAGVGEGVSAVFFLDLDRFKVFNDSAGHGVGDQILREVARRLRAALRCVNATPSPASAATSSWSCARGWPIPTRSRRWVGACSTSWPGRTTSTACAS